MHRPTVLAIDDDIVALQIIRSALHPRFRVETAGTLAAARVALANGAERFRCVLIDYKLPDGLGIDLLRWLKHAEAPVAAIMVTASEEHDVLQRTMIEGACNFLRKPLSAEDLRQAVAAAVCATDRREQVSEMRRQVSGAAKTQERLLHNMLQSDSFVEYAFCPKGECGGDFLVHHRLSNSDEVFMLSDVAGHDIAATVQSSFFHGWMTGVLGLGGRVRRALEGYNRRLLACDTANASIAVSILEVHHESGCIMAWNCGGPPPAYVDRRGGIQYLGARSSTPLGWFDELKPTRARAGTPCGPVWMWTDGLEQLADTLQADPLSIAYALLEFRNDRPEWLDRAYDDVLVARVWPGSRPGFVPPPCFHPLISQRHTPEAIPRIDSIQNAWRCSLLTAIPALPSSTLHDILLTSREALLNALRHGCAGQEDATYQVLYNPVERLLRARVEDCGQGHSFHWQSTNQDEPSGRSCGLLIIHSIATRVHSKRNGAELIMDYRFSPDYSILPGSAA